MAEMSAAADALVTCPMCFNVFDSPRTLLCNHSFCLSCIRGHCNDNVSAFKSFCPLCKENFQVPSNGVEDLQCDVHLQRLVDFRKSSCSSSEKMNISSDEVNVLSRRLRGVYCEKHGQQLTTSHCFGCQENICSQCSAAHHKDHQRKNIETFADELKPRIEADIRDVSVRITNIRAEREQLKLERGKFIEDLGEQAIAISQKGEELKSMIDRKVEELLQELENIKRDGLSSAETAESRLQQAADMMHSYCEYSQEICTKGRPHDVVRYANGIHAQCTDLGLLESHAIASAQYTSPCVVFISADSEQISTRQLLGYISTPLSSSAGTALTTLPDGEPLYNVTSLDNEIYVLRWKETEQIEVFDAGSYELVRCMTVPDLEGFADMTSCDHSRCLYVSDYINDCVHRVEVKDGTVTQWPVSDGPCGLSVSETAHSVLVTCHDVCAIKEFTSRGDPVRTITLTDVVTNPWHAIQLASSEFVVCHGGLEDPLHRVCRLDSDGCVVQSFGGPPGCTDPRQLNVPWHLAVDEREFVFVADHDNRRVVLLSPRLDYLREVVARDRLRWDPHRLCVDAVRRRLYVVENEWKNGEFAAGRVVIYNI